MKTVSMDIILFLARMDAPRIFGDRHPENLAPRARSRYSEVRLVVVPKCTGTHSCPREFSEPDRLRCWIGTISASSWRSPGPAACQPPRGNCAAPKRRWVADLLPLNPASV